MIKFYDHPQSGRLYLQANAGGGGPSDTTGMYDAPATQTDIDRNPVEYAEYRRLKEEGPGENDKNIPDAEARRLYTRDLEAQLANAKATIERLNQQIADHKD